MFREAMSNSAPMLVTVDSTDPSLSIFQTLNTSSSPFGSTLTPPLLEEARESQYVCTKAAKPPGAMVIQKHCNSRQSERRINL